MMTFYCKDCGLMFEHEGIRKEYQDVTFGPCAKYMAICKSCGNEVDEYRRPKPSKSFVPTQMAPCGNPGGCSCCS